MNSNQYLDAAKRAMKITSDYALAKRFDVTRQEISKVRGGKKPLSNYLCVKVAITLATDPATVIADIEQQTDKNPIRADFWRSFLSHASRTLFLMLAAICIATSGTGRGELGGPLWGFRRARQFA